MTKDRRCLCIPSHEVRSIPQSRVKLFRDFTRFHPAIQGEMSGTSHYPQPNWIDPCNVSVILFCCARICRQSNFQLTLRAGVIFRIPFYRELCLWIGAINASASICRKVLKSGKSLMTLPGGMNEQLISQTGDHTVYVRNRKVRGKNHSITRYTTIHAVVTNIKVGIRESYSRLTRATFMTGLRQACP